jgi:hypothetical protein
VLLLSRVAVIMEVSEEGGQLIGTLKAESSTVQLLDILLLLLECALYYSSVFHDFNFVRACFNSLYARKYTVKL